MKKTVEIFFCSVLLSGFAAAAAGAEYFVSPSGSDQNAGTERAPFRTITRACQAALPGDTVKLLPGSFFEHVVLRRSGRPDAKITIAGSRGKNGEYLSVVQAPGKVLKNWVPAPEIGKNVWKTPLAQRPDLVMKDGAMIAYINPLTMALPQRKELPAEIVDIHITSKFGPGCKRLAGFEPVAEIPAETALDIA